MYNALILDAQWYFSFFLLIGGSILCTLHKISDLLRLEKWPEERLCATMGHRVLLCVSADLEGRKRKETSKVDKISREFFFSLRRDKEKVAHYQSIFLFPIPLAIESRLMFSPLVFSFCLEDP